MIFLIYFCVASFAFAFWKWRRSSANDPPLYPGALPIIGHGHLFLGDSIHLWSFIKKLSHHSQKMGGVITILIGRFSTHILTDPDDSLTVSNTCLEKPYVYKFVKQWIGDGLVTADVSIWKSHRKLLNPSFNQTVLDGFVSVFNNQSRKLVKALSTEVGKGPFDHWPYLEHITLETTCLTTLGVSDNEDKIFTNEDLKALQRIFQIITERFKRTWMHFQFIYNFTNLKREQDKLFQILQNKSNTVLQERKKQLRETMDFGTDNANTPKRTFKAFLDLMLELADEGKTFTDIQIREYVDTMIAAGHETNAKTLLLTMIIIGSHPEVQEKILLKNYTLKANSFCIISAYGISRDKKWGPDVESFRPERWLDQALLPEANIQFAPFSMGRRNCIGKTFALMSMKITLAHVFRHYQINADLKNLVLKHEVMLAPVSGHYIAIAKRK